MIAATYRVIYRAAICLVGTAKKSGWATNIIAAASSPGWAGIITAKYCVTIRAAMITANCRILRTASRRITTRRLAGFVLAVAVLVNTVFTDFLVAWKAIRIQRSAVSVIK